jgi:hypothetical protein
MADGLTSAIYNSYYRNMPELSSFLRIVILMYFDDHNSPIFRDRDTERYKINFSDLYLINTHNENSDKKIPPIGIREYPATKGHLDKYWGKIKDRDDQGIAPYNLRRCAYMGGPYE